MGMAVGGGSSKRVMAEINITPFTDVCLVLLIIFMISASFASSADHKHVNLPMAGQKATSTLADEDLSITISNNGALYLNEAPVTLEALAADLKDANKHKKIRSIVIRGDRDVLYDQVVRVMDVVRRSGTSDMSLAVEQEKPGKGAI